MYGDKDYDEEELFDAYAEAVSYDEWAEDWGYGPIEELTDKQLSSWETHKLNKVLQAMELDVAEAKASERG